MSSLLSLIHVQDKTQLFHRGMLWFSLIYIACRWVVKPVGITRARSEKTKGFNDTSHKNMVSSQGLEIARMVLE